MSVPQFPGQKFVCKVEYRDDFEGSNGPDWSENEETFESETYDGLLEKLADHRYGDDTFNIEHNQTPKDRTYKYGPIMIVFSETPLDLAELRTTSHYDKFVKAVEEREKKGSSWISQKTFDKLKTK